MPQCVERFHRYCSNKKNIIAKLLKFAGYIHNHKILPGNIFGLILKNKVTLNKDFCWPSRAKDIIGRDLKFAGYIPHYKSVSLSVMKSAYISLIIGPWFQPIGNHGLGIFSCGHI